MTIQPNVRRGSRRANLLWTAALVTLSAIASVPGIANELAVSASSRVEDVSLADLNLSTPEGLRAARERLRLMAQRVCREHPDSRGPPSQPNFVACVDSTITAALGQIRSSTLNAVTRAANVSLADLNLTTPAGLHTARERLRVIARRLCAELAHSHELSYRPNFAACIDDTLAGALAQVTALAAAKDSRVDSRVAQRPTP
ncbi:MAG: UrcA family protein [Steroidobacteraceae bacterium]